MIILITLDKMHFLKKNKRIGEIPCWVRFVVRFVSSSQVKRLKRCHVILFVHTIGRHT